MTARRAFLKKSALLSLGTLASNLVSAKGKEVLENISQSPFFAEEYTLPALPYAYDALEPFIDKQTMELHHDKHHQAYVNNLNKALQNSKHPAANSLENIFKDMASFDVAVRNNGGGHYNHSLFWTLLKENKEGKQNNPDGKIAEAMVASFGSFEECKKQFGEAAAKRFGSGWAWLVVENKKLKIGSTANQDNPLMSISDFKGRPVLALDVWEHAYYLKYQNKRADYINAWWNVVNWNKANELFAKAE